jgi:hypothetical protein
MVFAGEFGPSSRRRCVKRGNGERRNARRVARSGRRAVLKAMSDYVSGQNGLLRNAIVQANCN